MAEPEETLSTPNDTSRRPPGRKRRGSRRTDDEQLALWREAAPTPPSPPAPPAVFGNRAIRSTAVYDTYWYLAAERQSIFFRKLCGAASTTDDPILRQFKFTNAYRASDRVSQYLIQNVIYEGDQDPEEVFFRTILFKTFNKVETWECLSSSLGQVSYQAFDFERYARVLDRALAEGRSIYSAAYIMASGKSAYGHKRKHRNHLQLLQHMMTDGAPHRVAEADSMAEVFQILRSYPSLGPFLAYQYTVDLNYSALIDFSENDFVMAGPGAKDGIRKCFSDLDGCSEEDVICMVAERQEQEFERLGLKFQSLWGRPLHLIDCQNLFCEVDKYARVAHPDVIGLSGRSRIKQRYRPHAEPMRVWYPPKWGINDAIPPQLRAK